MTKTLINTRANITEEAIDLWAIENDVKENIVRISLSKEFLDMHNEGKNNIELVVKAQEGHNLYNYDGHYDYLLGIWSFQNGQWICEYAPVDLSECEKSLINTVVYVYRDKARAAYQQIAKAIADKYGSMYNLHYENLIGAKYISEWVSLDGLSMLGANVKDVEDIDDGELYSIDIQEYSNEE